jgi:hypothetical protein
MRTHQLSLSAVSILLLGAPLAHAQLAINVPVPAPESAVDQPGIMGTPSPALGSSPGGAAGTPDPSTVVGFSEDIRPHGKTYAAASTVRVFDPAKGVLSLLDGTEVTFPANFAFVDTPQPGQPVTIYYFEDRNGQHLLSAIDLGGQGGDSGG